MKVKVLLLQGKTRKFSKKELTLKIKFLKLAQLQFPLHFYSINLNFGLLNYLCVCVSTLCTLKYTNVRTHASSSLPLLQSLPLRLHNTPITRTTTTTTTKVGTTTRDTMSVCCCVWCVVCGRQCLSFSLPSRHTAQHSTGKAGTAKSQIKVSGCVAVAAVCGQSVKYFHHCW